MVEIPEATIVERLRSRETTEGANEADGELPNKLDADSDASLLQKYGTSPEDLRHQSGGRSPVGAESRWGAERTFAWISHNRCMSKDYERLCSAGEAFVYGAITRLMVRRLARGHLASEVVGQ